MTGTASILTHYDSFPDSANVRLPVVAALSDCSEATVWWMVKRGRFACLSRSV